MSHSVECAGTGPFSSGCYILTLSPEISLPTPYPEIITMRLLTTTLVLLLSANSAIGQDPCTGSLYCCASIADASTKADFFTEAGIPLPQVLIGLTCNSFSSCRSIPGC